MLTLNSLLVTFVLQASGLKDKVKELESNSHQLQKNVNYYKSQFNQSVTQVRILRNICWVAVIHTLFYLSRIAFQFAYPYFRTEIVNLGFRSIDVKLQSRTLKEV